MRQWISHRDWEAIVGGNLLNKIGALLLVVGIALFCGYSFHRVGPAGRAAAAIATSATILAAGIWLERRETYQAFGRGLIGAGWAALYATAYAIYALPAARLIENALAGSLLQLSVAGGMILHSLRYRSQTVTSVAYFAAFLALAVTPSSPMAVVSLFPLAASLLYLAYRFSWHRMALFGLLATYLTCATRGSTGTPLWSVQSLFILYWFVFESFDLLRARSSGRTNAEESVGSTQATFLLWIFPLNAVGFIGLSYTAWSVSRSNDLWMMTAMAAVLYSISAVARLLIRPPSSLEGLDFGARLRQGSFEAPLAIAALMSGMAIVARVPGVWRSLALVVPAEFLYLAGAHFRSAFLRRLGFAGFTGALLVAAFDSAVHPGRTLLFGHSFRHLTPSLALHAAVFYLNRCLRSNDRISSWPASILLSLIIGLETPDAYSGLLQIGLGAALFELGWRKRLREYVWQGAGIAAFGAWALCWQHGAALSRPAPFAVWFSLLAASAIGWAWALRIVFSAKHPLEPEARPVREGAACVSSFLLLMASIVLVPAAFVTAAWFPIACVCFSLGVRFRVSSFRGLAHAILFCASFRVAAFDVPAGRDWYLPVWALAAMGTQWLAARRGWPDVRWHSHWLALVTLCVALWDAVSGNTGPAGQASIVATIAAFYAMQFMNRAPGPPAQYWFERHARELFSLYGTALLTTFLWAEVSGKVLTMTWGLQGLVLLAAGFPLRDRALRWPGLALLLACVCKLFLYDLRNLESPYRTLSFIALGAILLGVSWIYARFRERVRGLA